MADTSLGSMIYIKNVSKKETSFNKILARLRKVDNGKGSWSPEGLDEVQSGMICENVIELVDGAYKIKSNQDKNLTNDQNFAGDTFLKNSLGKTLSSLIII